jgi:hypothetical protein
MKGAFGSGRYANVTSTLALVVALGGTSYAAISLPANSVGSKQIKKNGVTKSDIKSNAVTSSKVKDGSLLKKDFKPGQLPAGAPGAPGAKGDKGDRGDTGAPGLGLTADQTLPSGETEVGTYAASANVNTGYGVANLDFRPKLSAAIPNANTHYVTSPTAQCPGSASNPTAAAGHLCLYQGQLINMNFLGVFVINAPSGTGTDTHGATLFFQATAIQGRAFGVWATTAP